MLVAYADKCPIAHTLLVAALEILASMQTMK